MVASKLPNGFSQDFGGREEPCIGIFGPEGSGKTRLAATAGEYASEHGQIPGWIVCDRKTRKTVREVCEELGLDIPLINSKDFITQDEALALALNENFVEVQKVYTKAVRALFEAAVTLGKSPNVNPIIFDSGTQLWDWIAFSHFGRKQDAGKARVWGPPKQDWTDLMDGLSHKKVVITLRAKEEWLNKMEGDKDKSAPTGRLTTDGPPHLGYTVTSLIRLRQERTRKLKEGEDYVERFALDVVQSQDNVGLEGVDEILRGRDITFSNLMMQLRPGEE